MDEVKVFEDPLNWQQNRLPCKTDRIVFSETVSVIINSSVSAKEIVLPYNGAIIFGENAEIELYENGADDSCPGEDLIFTGKGSSHWEAGDNSWSFLRIFLNFAFVLFICAAMYAIYLNQSRGMTVREMIMVVNTSARQISGRLSQFYVQRPAEGTFDFVRFQGHDDNIELELGAHAAAIVSGPGTRTVGQTEEPRRDAAPTPPVKAARSLRGLGYMTMSDIEEVEEEDHNEVEQEEQELIDLPVDTTVAKSTDPEFVSDKRHLLDEE